MEHFLWDLPPHKAQDIRKNVVHTQFINSYMTNLAQREREREKKSFFGVKTDQNQLIQQTRL